MTGWIIGGIVIAVMLAVAIPLIIKDYKKNKDQYVITPEKLYEMEEEILNREAEITDFNAEIIDMVCGTGTIGGYMLPKSQKSFLLVFKKDDGDIIHLAVAEEIYLEMEIGMAGKVTLLDGRLDSFVLFDDEATKNISEGEVE